MSLPADITRCMGVDPNRRYICPERESCQRHTDNRPGHILRYSYMRLMREPGQECEHILREGV